MPIPKLVHACRFFALFALYLLLAQSFEWAELIAGASCATVAVIAVTATSRHSPTQFPIEARWLRPMLRLPYEIVRDSFLVLAAIRPRHLASRTIGAFHEIGVRRAGSNPGSPGWRALEIGDVSMAPNTYVVEMGDRHYRMLVHRLVGNHREAAR